MTTGALASIPSMDMGMPPRPMALTATGPMVLVCIWSPYSSGVP